MLYKEEKKKVAVLQHQLELERIKTRKVMSSKNKGKLCPKCLNDSHETKKTMGTHVKEDMKDFS